MRPSRRFGVNKGRSVRQFKKKAARTNKRNLAIPMRGGIRL